MIRSVLLTARLLCLAALAGAAVMVLEIAAPRLAAPHVGTGPLAWTVTIATFLAGLALGQALGGRLADRVGRWLPGALLLLAAGLTWGTPTLHAWATEVTASLRLDTRVFAAIPLAFLPVSFVLGAVPPVLVHVLLRRGRGPGWRLGAMAAAGAAGSVAGTFLAGFVLVPAIGLGRIFDATAAALAIAALLAPWGTRRVAAVPAPTDTTLPRGSWIALAAFAGAAVLALEILAGRVASDRLGASVYTWTSVIGVVLAGLAIGALLGGRLADRYAERIAPARLLGVLLLVSSACAMLLLWAPALLSLADGLVRDRGLAWPTAVLAVSTLAFLLPAAVLGSLSPVVIRAALQAPEHDGRVVGGLYAAGTAGAVVGAVAVGWVLIPWAGLERLTLLLAFGLATAAGLLRGRQPYAFHTVILLIALFVQGPWEETRELARTVRLSEQALSYDVEDSRLSRIRVQPVFDAVRSVPLHEGPSTIGTLRDEVLRGQALYDPFERRLYWRGRMTEEQRDRLRELVTDTEGHDAVNTLFDLTGHDYRQLRLDRLVHGCVDLQDPDWLGYGYERLYVSVIEELWPERDVVRCFFIGGGAYAIQRHLLTRHGDGISCVTAEIDPAVTAVARRYLAFEASARHEVVHEDARTYVARGSEGTPAFDVVFGDAFDHFSVPFHLTTREFASALRARLAPDGVYLLNVVDVWSSGHFLGAVLTTLETTFPHVRILSESPRRPDARDTFVVVASDQPLDAWAQELGERATAAIEVYTPGELDDLRARAGHRVLTDDHAPVETLLAPIFRTR